MPKAIGSPVTYTNVQPQREVTTIIKRVSYDAAGAAHFSIVAYGIIRVRDAAGNILWSDPTGEHEIGNYGDSQITGTFRTGTQNEVTFLDGQ